MYSPHPAIYVVFAVMCFIIVVWLRKELVPLWYACLTVIVLLVALLQHHPIQMMACGMIMAGGAQVLLPYRGIQFMRRKSDSPISQKLAQFYATPLGTICYRSIGILVIIFSITNWVSARSIDYPPPPIDTYPANYRQLMESVGRQISAPPPKPTLDKDGNATTASVKNALAFGGTVYVRAAKHLRLIEPPPQYRRLHLKTLAYFDAVARAFLDCSKELSDSQEISVQQLTKARDSADPEEAELRTALIEASKKSDEFAIVLGSLSPAAAPK